MRVKEIKLYKFEELSKEAQQRAIDANREINVNYDWYASDIKDFIKDAKKIGFDIKFEEVEFDLDRKANFSVGRNGISVINDYIKKKLKIRSKPWVDIKFNVKKIGVWHEEFPHMRWSQSDENVSGWYEVIIENGQGKDNEIKELCSEMVSELCELCKEYYSRVAYSYENLMSDESIKDALIANECEFEEDGSRA